MLLRVVFGPPEACPAWHGAAATKSLAMHAIQLIFTKTPAPGAVAVQLKELIGTWGYRFRTHPTWTAAVGQHVHSPIISRLASALGMDTKGCLEERGGYVSTDELLQELDTFHNFYLSCRHGVCATDVELAARVGAALAATKSSSLSSSLIAGAGTGAGGTGVLGGPSLPRVPSTAGFDTLGHVPGATAPTAVTSVFNNACQPHILKGLLVNQLFDGFPTGLYCTP